MLKAFSHFSCLILIGAFLAGGGNSVDFCEAAEPKQKCLLIEHVTGAHGTVSTYVTADAVKVVFLNIHGYLISRAPSWKVVLVNMDAKLIYEDDYKHWINRLISHSYIGGTGDQCDFALSKAGKKTYAGRKCSLYTVGSTSALASYVVIEPSVVPSQGCRVLEKWFGTPFMDAVPVAYHWEHNGVSQSQENRNSKPTNTVFTDHVDCLQTRIIKDTECPRSFFSYPSGLEEVHSEVDIFASKKQTKEIEDALRDLGTR
jgi:hypothetical protein